MRYLFRGTIAATGLYTYWWSDEVEPGGLLAGSKRVVKSVASAGTPEITAWGDRPATGSPGDLLIWLQPLGKELYEWNDDEGDWVRTSAIGAVSIDLSYPIAAYSSIGAFV